MAAFFIEAGLTDKPVERIDRNNFVSLDTEKNIVLTLIN